MQPHPRAGIGRSLSPARHVVQLNPVPPSAPGRTQSASLRSVSRSPAVRPSRPDVQPMPMPLPSPGESTRDRAARFARSPARGQSPARSLSPARPVPSLAARRAVPARTIAIEVSVHARPAPAGCCARAVCRRVCSVHSYAHAGLLCSALSTAASGFGLPRRVPAAHSRSPMCTPALQRHGASCIPVI